MYDYILKMVRQFGLFEAALLGICVSGFVFIFALWMVISGYN